MDEVYGVLDAKELPRFEDSVNHKVYVTCCFVSCMLWCGVVLYCCEGQVDSTPKWFAVL